MVYFLVFFFKQKTAYEMRISDWSSDVCSSDLGRRQPWRRQRPRRLRQELNSRKDTCMFRRPSIRYGQSPEPVTPYQRAAQVWDDRIGSARSAAKNWTPAFFGCLALSGGFSAGLVWQSARGNHHPWVCEVAQMGGGHTRHSHGVGKEVEGRG